MTLAEHLLRFPPDNGGLRVAADALLDRGDENGELLAWFASLGARYVVLHDDEVTRARLIQASNEGLILQGRRWSKKRRSCDCGGGFNRPHYDRCSAIRDVCLYKLGRPLGDPTAPGVKYTYEQIFSVGDVESWFVLRLDDEENVEADWPLYESALSLAGQPDSPWARHIISQALKQEFRMVRGLASFAAYRLLQNTPETDPLVVASMLRIAEQDAEDRRRHWYGQRWIDSNFR